MYKQAIVFRKDLKISKGKIISQGCDALLGTFLEADEKIKSIWLKEGSKKIILTVKNLKDLTLLYKKAKKMKLPCYLVKDAGLTQVERGTVTCLGIGPEDEKKVDKVSGKLKLL